MIINTTFYPLFKSCIIFFRDTVVPMRWPVVFSNFPIADHEEFLSKPLSAFSITTNRETATSTYGETAKAVKPIMLYVNKKERLLWKRKAEEGVKDFYTCLEANPEFLSKPLSSLSLADKPKASTSTEMKTGKAVKPIIFSKSNANQKERLLWKKKGEEGVKDFSTCLEANPVESKPLSSRSLADKPEASTSTDMKTGKAVKPIIFSKSNANQKERLL
ncbi:uncharacterized protein LOC133720469 [Rosa rugosa]|uniref:uncharacterized protein LOC133720469 n=1 Tax=Rosa rugosa TaxID=74645 RepID=UPI002B416E6B|nr:uncharacterized protein LOC133720469 [Rosa rugosa]